MAYTPSPNKTKSVVPVQASLFSNLQMDGARNALTGVLGNRMRSYDATGGDAPNGDTIYSPQSNVDDAAGLAITIPQDAAQISIYCSVVCQVGEDSSLAYGVYIPAATYETFDVANQQYIYILPSSSTNTTAFFFNVI